MVKVRIKEIADELGIKSKEVVEKAHDLGIEAKAAGSAISDKDAEILINYVLTGDKPSAPEPKETVKKSTKKVVVEKPVAEEKEEVVVEKPIEKVPVVEEKVPEPVKEEAKVDTVEETPAPAKAEAPKEEVKPKAEPVVEETPAPVKEEVKPTQETKEAPVTTEEVTPKAEVKPAETSVKEAPKPMLKKRRGLVIVKKKRPVVVEKTYVHEKFKKVSSEVNIPKNDNIKKKTKATKYGATKKDQNQKLNLLEDRDFGFSSNAGNASDEQLVVMPDFVDIIEKKPDAPKPADRKPRPVGRRGTPQNFNRGGRGITRKKLKKKARKGPQEDLIVTHVEIPEDCRVYEFAEKLNRPISDVIKALFLLGMMVTKNDFLDKDMIEILAEEFEVEVTTVNPLDDFDYEKDYDLGDEADLSEKPPVVTIMGHVDHGKTSLLDHIREANIAGREAGGITQHIGAYMVEKNGKNITFMDTPGHEAFTHLRSRGAQATDIVIIVVAADDGVKPQTKEAVQHALDANAPIIVAVNKMDKPDANIDLAKGQMAEIGITPTDWGGEHDFIPVSAKTGLGISELLETILLQAELLELKANVNAKAKAVVIESTIEKGRGPVSTIVLQNGTLKIGDPIVAGVAYGKVRALLDHQGKSLKSVSAGEPCVVVGMNKTPSSGDFLIQEESEKKAREYAEKRAEHIRQKELSKSTKVTLDELGGLVAEGKLKRLPLVIKADAQGSLEAIRGSIEKIITDETKIDIILSGIGNISESDIALASAGENTKVLGFHVKMETSARAKSKSDGVEVKTYDIIYDLIDDVKQVVAGMLSPVIREEELGKAEVREVFNVPKLGAIAGCMVINGTIEKRSKVRVLRGEEVIHEGPLSSLKHFKDDVREVKKGFECGIGLEGFNDMLPQDIIEVYKEVEEMATLD